MLNHVEQKNGEMWVGNTHHVDGVIPHLRSLKTTRVGDLAYDIHGKKIHQDYCRPLFIHKSEYQRYDDIMTARARV